MIRIARLAPLAFSFAIALPAAAGDLSTIGNLSQDQFRRLSEDLGATFSYKGVTPATPLGLVGFDVGLEVSGTDVKHSDIFSRAGGGAPSTLYVPKLHVYKGLFARLDIGAFVGAVSSVNATAYGADLRYAIFDDTLTMPAVAVRVSGTKSTGGGQIDVSTIAGDLMVSKRLTIVTPYIGAGVVRVSSDAKAGGLADETFNKSRIFGGFNANFGLLNLAFEAEGMGGNTTLSAKAGWRF
jgi:hypothetical protein